MMPKIRLKRGDQVVVLSGKFKGQSGPVLAVWPKLGKVTVAGINKGQRVLKVPNQAVQRREVTKPLAVSKLAIIEPKSGRPSRLYHQTDKNGLKQRYFCRTRQPVPAPKPVKIKEAL